MYVRACYAMPGADMVEQVGTFWGTGTVAEDVFGLGAVNRNRSIGCSTSPVGKPTWDSALAEWVVSQVSIVEYDCCAMSSSDFGSCATRKRVRACLTACCGH
eukprot:596029-Rhodomonas_salina.4